MLKSVAGSDCSLVRGVLASSTRYKAVLCDSLKAASWLSCQWHRTLPLRTSVTICADVVPLSLQCRDSEAHFELRAAEVGLSTNALSALKGHNLATLGKLAHVVSSPVSPPQPEALADWIRDNLRNASLGDQACVRRLIWEGGALATAELRDQITNPEGSSQRKVPDAERTKRLQLLKNSLNGIVLEGPLEPSHVLLDKAAGLERDNQLRFLAPETCASRSWEITHGKPERPVLTFEANKLLVKPHSDVPECPPYSCKRPCFEGASRSLLHNWSRSLHIRSMSWPSLCTLVGSLQLDMPDAQSVSLPVLTGSCLKGWSSRTLSQGEGPMVSIP